MTTETEQASSAPAMPESFNDPGEAANWLSSQDEAAAKANENSSAERAQPATAEAELPDEGNTAPPEEATGETQEDAPAEKPQRELPRSWTKEHSERWAKLDPETQDYLLEQDRKASAEVRRVQNEAAEKLKGLTAKEQAAEQARQNYETQAKAAYDALLREQQRDFPDVKSMEDVARLAQTDPFRYIQWQAHQQELQAQAQTVRDADARQTQQKADEWKSYRNEQDKLAIEHIPDLGDAAKAPALMKKAVDYLQDVGFTPEELGRLDGGEKLSLFDHRVQRFIFDGIRYRDMQAAKAAAVVKPVPNVQRPGTKSASNANADNIQALNNRLSQTHSLDDAVALYAARGAARR